MKMVGQIGRRMGQGFGCRSRAAAIRAVTNHAVRFEKLLATDNSRVIRPAVAALSGIFQRGDFPLVVAMHVTVVTVVTVSSTVTVFLILVVAMLTMLLICRRKGQHKSEG
jgi:ABC-type transport system involved in cytochrome bd biosynthesis fused ATPase/permease subunit